jgi:uncharacterized protein
MGRIDEIEVRVKHHFEEEGSGHDWWHILRVRNLAMKIAESEPVDPMIVELGALLHDVADHKLFQGSMEEGLEVISQWLQEAGFDDIVCRKVTDIARDISYKGAGVEDAPLSAEGQVVRDADRLDAIGAIGIARAFAFGGNRGRLLYNPDVPPVMHGSFEAYRTSDAPTINHFYEKLLLLKDRMHTKTGLEMAAARHRFMEQYLNQFFDEWQANR